MRNSKRVGRWRALAPVVAFCMLGTGCAGNGGSSQAPTPSPTASQTVTDTPTPLPSATLTWTATPPATASATPTATDTLTAIPSPTAPPTSALL